MFLYFCTFLFCTFVFLYFFILYFCIFVLFYFVLFYFCNFVLLYFFTFSFGWTVHTNFYAKSGVCSSKNDWVMSTFILTCFFVLFVLFFGLSIWTSMQNLESVALKMTELWVLLYLCTFFCSFCTFVIYLDYPYELPCKIWSL